MQPAFSFISECSRDYRLIRILYKANTITIEYKLKTKVEFVKLIQIYPNTIFICNRVDDKLNVNKIIKS